MKRYAWLTDIHLNFLQPPSCHGFLDSVNREQVVICEDGSSP